MVRQEIGPSASLESSSERRGCAVSDDWPEILPITREELDLLKCHMDAIIGDMLEARET